MFSDFIKNFVFANNNNDVVTHNNNTLHAYERSSHQRCSM